MERRVGQRWRREPVALRGSLQEMPREPLDVARPTLAQRRELERDDLHAEVQILAEPAVRHHSFEVAIGRRHDPNVGGDRLGPAHSQVGSVLRDAEELSLHRERELAKLVEEQCPSARRIELAERARVRALPST